MLSSIIKYSDGSPNNHRKKQAKTDACKIEGSYS